MRKTHLFIYILLFVGISPNQSYSVEKIGFFDMREVMLNSNVGKQAAEDFKKVFEQQKAKITNVENDLKSRKDNLEKTRSILTEAALREAESDYRNRIQSYQLLVKNANEVLQKMDKELSDKLVPQIVKIVDGIKEREKYAAILDKKDAGISYSKDKDITSRIIKEVNQYTAIYSAQGNYAIQKDEIVSSLDSTPPVILITSPAVFRGVKLTAKDASITVIGTTTDESGVATVTVNGETVAIDANGNFSAEVLLKVGENRIVVAATDIRKNTATETFTLIREAGQVAKVKPEANQPTVGIVGGKYYGLIIGNNDYRYLSRLQTAVNDATTIENILKESYGFESRLLLNATRKDILTAINEFRNKLSERDNLLIYYAGHGEFDRSADKAYWLPVDALRDDPTDWIMADDITSSIKRLSSKHVLIISDSCYSGTLTRSTQTSMINKGERDEFLKKMTSRPSRTLLASGGNEPVADGGGSGHSIFADSFLKALREIDNSIFTADELFYQYIRSRVAGRSDQVPEYSEIRNSGHDGGDFVFRRSK